MRLATNLLRICVGNVVVPSRISRRSYLAIRSATKLAVRL